MMFLYIDFREEGGGARRGEGETLICCHLFMHLLVDFYMCPDGGLNHNLDVLGWCFNKLSYLVRDPMTSF